MVEKFKFILWVVFGVGVAYVLLTVSMPVITTLAFGAADEATAANFPSFQAGVRWVPLFLYFVPAVTGLGLIVWKLKVADRFK